MKLWFAKPFFEAFSCSPWLPSARPAIALSSFEVPFARWYDRFYASGSPNIKCPFKATLSLVRTSHFALKNCVAHELLLLQVFQLTWMINTENFQRAKTCFLFSWGFFLLRYSLSLCLFLKLVTHRELLVLQFGKDFAGFSFFFTLSPHLFDGSI